MFEPISRGLRIVSCCHSFYGFAPPLLAEMAGAAGIAGHTDVAISSVGGSRGTAQGPYVLHHWNLPDEEDVARAALRAGGVDLLALSPIWLPDEGIAQFARLAVAHNPEIRVTLHAYWLPNDTFDTTLPLKTSLPVDHDATDLAELRKEHQPYFQGMEDLARDLNRQPGREVVLVVPVGLAVLALRELIVAGQAPGLTRQNELFNDSWGHPAPPLQVLTAYCHFAAMYRRNPAGLPLPSILAENPAWDDNLNGLLQRLAWEAVSGIA